MFLEKLNKNIHCNANSKTMGLSSSIQQPVYVVETHAIERPTTIEPLIYDQSREAIQRGFAKRYVDKIFHNSSSFEDAIAKKQIIPHISKFYHLQYYWKRFNYARLTDVNNNNFNDSDNNFTDLTVRNGNIITNCGYAELFEVYGLGRRPTNLNVYCIELNTYIIVCLVMFWTNFHLFFIKLVC